jgi:hypothetical protein
MNLYYVYIFVPIYLVTNNEYLPIHITNHNHNLNHNPNTELTHLSAISGFFCSVVENPG